MDEILVQLIGEIIDDFLINDIELTLDGIWDELKENKEINIDEIDEDDAKDIIEEMINDYIED